MAKQAWFVVKMPSGLKVNQYLFWEDQGEATLYHNGIPHAGLDVAHPFCRLPEAKEVWIDARCLSTGIWVPGAKSAINHEGCRFERVSVAQRNEEAWQTFHDLDVLLQLAEIEYKEHPHLTAPFGATIGRTSPFESVSPLLRRCLRWIEDALCAYERDGFSACRAKLGEAYADLKSEDALVSAHLTGHAHIDLVWLWREVDARFKTTHTFASTLRMMEEYPEFKFGFSQPAAYRGAEEDAPKLMEAVRDQIKQGRWEATGAMEVESDTQIPCGEALLRSLMVGQEGFTDLNGQPSKVLWLPDVFGYTACLPQLLLATGVDYFFTTKLHWSSVNSFPYSSFWWEGIDGSRVLSHVSQDMGYNGNVTPAEIRRGVAAYRQGDVHDALLVPVGFGDGGGGVTAEMCETRSPDECLGGCTGLPLGSH